MFQIEKCPCCGDTNGKGCWAIVAPFIRDYVRPAADRRITSLRECQTCGHRYFAYGYDDREMASLYSGYRGSEYFSVRRKCEPWYTSKANTVNLDEAFVKRIKDGLADFLRPSSKEPAGKMIIADVGGDAGQFIPLELASHAYVVETSAQAPVAGVIRVQNLAEIPYGIDLIICSHVLEHTSDPLTFLRGITFSGNTNDDCLFYLELPLERYSISSLMRYGLYRRYLQAISAIRPVTIAVDFLSVLARTYANAAFPPLLLKQHEHVNFYTTESLARLASAAGLDVIRITEEKSGRVRTHGGIIRLLARKSAPPRIP